MGRIRLIENTIVSNSDIKKVALTEGKKIIQEGKEYECIAAYTFPISRPDETNLNERIYNTPLWERVIKLKMGEGTYGLMDHPDSEGSTKDKFCVWHNIRFGESKGKKVILADCYLFGKWGQQVEDGVKAGGDVGLSTVGFGEFLEDEKTIDPDTYELERASDHVLNPSYEVYGNLEDKIENNSKEDKVLEKNETMNIEKKDPLDIPEEKTDKESDKMKDDMKESKVTKLEEKNFRLQIKNLIKEADAKEDVHDKKKEYEDILTYFEGDFAKDLRNQVLEKITKCNTSIKELAEKGLKLESVEKTAEDLKTEIAEKDKRIEELEAENKKLSEDYKNSLELNDSLKVYSKRMDDKVTEKNEAIRNKDAEINGMVTPTEYKEINVYCEAIEAENKTLKKDNRALKEEIKIASRKERVEKTSKKESKPKTEKKSVKEQLNKPESLLDIKNEDAVLDYYYDLLEADSRVEEIKDYILECKTVMEAQTKYLRLKGTLEGEDKANRELENDRDVFEGEGFVKNRPSSIALDDYEEDFNIREGWD